MVAAWLELLGSMENLTQFVAELTTDWSLSSSVMTFVSPKGDLYYTTQVPAPSTIIFFQGV